MKKQFLRGLIIGALATMGTGVSTLAQADGTASLDLTVEANITAGTCSASVVDGETATATIGLGNVYISEVWAKSKSKPFSLRFSDCAGLKDKTAKLRITPSNTLCTGGSSNNPEFANNSASETKAAKTGIEIWSTATPAGSGSVQFNCGSPDTSEQTIDLSAATSTTPVDYPLSARLVPVSGGTTLLSQLTAGDFLSNTVFTITYQ
ncbi:fimbrial protein [Citrobacter sp. Ce105]|uniref:fimbrial protein n=1 Tax=Citrobacter sp. Ce105 TaxID=2985041 RepID=UPI002574E276|nr:fimbrial protein [Citrobacter sp. Ce105]MDM3288705.1 fimbrial protein [Citrobacter sp. Ce105]